MAKDSKRGMVASNFAHPDDYRPLDTWRQLAIARGHALEAIRERAHDLHQLSRVDHPSCEAFAELERLAKEAP